MPPARLRCMTVGRRKGRGGVCDPNTGCVGGGRPGERERRDRSESKIRAVRCDGRPTRRPGNNAAAARRVRRTGRHRPDPTRRSNSDQLLSCSEPSLRGRCEAKACGLSSGWHPLDRGGGRVRWGGGGGRPQGSPRATGQRMAPVGYGPATDRRRWADRRTPSDLKGDGHQTGAQR